MGFCTKKKKKERKEMMRNCRAERGVLKKAMQMKIGEKTEVIGEVSPWLGQEGEGPLASRQRQELVSQCHRSKNARGTTFHLLSHE